MIKYIVRGCGICSILYFMPLFISAFKSGLIDNWWSYFAGLVVAGTVIMLWIGIEEKIGKEAKK